MATGVYVPIWGLQMSEATLAKWLVQEGQPVKKGQGLAVIETYKISGEVESPQDGLLRRRTAQVGDVLKVGALLAVVGPREEDETEIDKIIRERPFVTDQPITPPQMEAAPPPQASLPQTPRPRPTTLRATPLARKLAKERGIDLKTVKPSSPSGRIHQRDVLAAAREPAPASTTAPEDKIIPLTTLRRAIIAKTLQTLNIPSGALSRTVRVDNLLDFRKSLAQPFEKKHGLKLSLTHLFFKAVALALEETPILNSTLQGDNIILKGAVNLGMVVTPPSGGGIMIPVLKNVAPKPLAQIAAEWTAMTDRLQKNALTFDDLSGGTFTISNVGAMGLDLFTPLIHPPEAGILGVSRIKKEPVVQNDQILIGRTLTLILGADHRLYDAEPIGLFLGTLDDLFQNPNQLLI